MQHKKSFILMRDLLSTVDLMTDEEAGQLLKSIVNHVDGKPVQLSRELTFAFTPIKNQLDRDMEKYDNFVKKQKVNGAKGGRPKKNPNNPSLSKETQNSQANPNNLVTDTVTVNATVNGNGIETANDNKKERKKRFAPPSINQIKEYISEKCYSVNPDTFFNHYESNGWKVGKNPMRSWKAALANWNSKDAKSKPMTEKERFYAEMRGESKPTIEGEFHVVK